MTNIIAATLLLAACVVLAWLHPSDWGYFIVVGLALLYWTVSMLSAFLPSERDMEGY